jgi:hypothetical protein
VVEREIDRLHARIVALRIADTVVPLFGGNRLGVEFFFQKPEEGFEKIDMESARFFDDFTDFVINDADEGNRAQTVFLSVAVDYFDDGTRFFRRINERIGVAFEFDSAKLIQQCLTDIFSSQAGTVGNIKHMARGGHSVIL